MTVNYRSKVTSSGPAFRSDDDGGNASGQSRSKLDKFASSSLSMRIQSSFRSIERRLEPLSDSKGQKKHTDLVVHDRPEMGAAFPFLTSIFSNVAFSCLLLARHLAHRPRISIGLASK